MESIIVAEKIRRPRLTGLRRERLERRLIGARAPGLALVLGPAGSGKTTLLSMAAAAAAVPTVWYRATAEDGGRATLLCHLARGLGLDGTVEGPEPTAEVDQVIAALERRARPALLVVDDLHEILGSAAEASLERFLTLRPRTVRVLLGSRRPPRINTPRLLVSGELDQLEADDLRFRSWEVEELFRTVYDRALSPETAAALTRRTGGWAAGLRLFHLATADLTGEQREQAVADLNGRSRLVRSYLARNVLDGLPDDRRTFLVRSCTLGVLTAAGCDGLLERTDSAAVLADLDAQQFFTSSSDGGRTYRYHPVLQTHLEVLLVDELGDAEARRLYARAADLLERAGLWEAARRAHARAEDWGAVARLRTVRTIGSGGARAEGSGHPGPADPGADDPGLALATARRLARDGRLAEAVVTFGLAEAQMDDPGFRRRCAEERAAVAAWLPGDAAGPPGWAGTTRPRTLSAELRAVSREVRAPEGLGFPLSRAAGLLLGGDPAGAAAELAHPDPTSDPAWVRTGTGVLRLACRLGLGAAVRPEEVDPLILSADVEGLAWLSRLARSLQTALRVAADAQPWRLATAADQLDEYRRSGDRWTEALAGLALGAAALAADRREPARTFLARAAEAAAAVGAPVLGLWAEALRLEAGPTSPDDPAAAGGHPDPGDLRRRAVRLGVDPGPVLARLRAGGRARSGPGAGPGVPTGPVVTVGCLGPFRLQVGPAELPWRDLRPRARALLMLLAVHHGQPVHREELVAQLWPDAALASGVRSLQVAVSTLRRLLASTPLLPDGLRREGDAYALDLAGARVPHREFEAATVSARRAAARGDSTRALSDGLAALDRYTGDLLPEAGPAEWVVRERDRLRQLAARTAAETARRAAQLAQVDTAIAAARRALELDPYDDGAWTMLADLQQQTGSAAAAAATRRGRGRVLAELGL